MNEHAHTSLKLRPNSKGEDVTDASSIPPCFTRNGLVLQFLKQTRSSPRLNAATVEENGLIGRGCHLVGH